MKECYSGAVIERGKITSVSSGEYTVESIDRPGIVSLPAKPINPETYSVNDAVYFFVCQDGTGRVMSKVDRVSPVIPQSDIVNDVVTNDSTKVASAAVAKFLNDTFKTLRNNLAMRQIASSSYKATSTNYEYVNVTFTVPTGCTYLVWMMAVYSSGGPVGIILTNSTAAPSAANTVHKFEWESTNAVGKSPALMLVAGTYYMWVKRASVPSSANNHYVYGVTLYAPDPT